MDKLLEMTAETFEEILAWVGMPVWAAYQEAAQAEQELPNGTPEQIYARTYQILYEKFGKPREGA